MRGKILLIFVFALLVLPIASAAWNDTLNVGLKAYYPLNQTTGTNVPDAFSQIFNMTTFPSDDTDWVSGLVGNARFFDGASDYIAQSNPNLTLSVANGYQNGTISIWINATSEGEDYFMGRLDSGTNTGDFYLLKEADEMIQWVVRNSSAGGRDVTSDGSITLGVWNHIAVSWGGDGTNMHVNGVRQMDNESGAISKGITPEAEFWIIGGAWRNGENNNSAVLPFEGEIDEIGIWNRTLTTSEILEIYNNGTGSTFAPTVPIPPAPPDFITIPANASIDYLVPLGVLFVANDSDGIGTWSVSDTGNFTINSTGFLTNATTLTARTYVITVSVNDTLGATNSTPWQATVNKLSTTCSLVTNSPLTIVTGLTADVFVNGTCDNPETSVTLYRDGADVTGENAAFVALTAGTYSYVVNTTETTNFLIGTQSASVTVNAGEAIGRICAESDLSFGDAAQLAGILLTILLVGTVLATLVLSFTGVVDLGKISQSLTIENLPAGIVVVGLTFLILATMSFLIAGNVCPAYGA